MIKKIIFIFLTSLFLPLSLSAKFVYINEDILTPIAQTKIEQLGEELYQKTGISLYIAAVKKIKEKNFAAFMENIAKNLKEPYILLAFSEKDHKVDLLLSNDIHSLINKTDVLIFYGPIIPKFFLDKKDKYSMGLFEGYIYIADKVADIYHVKLVTNLGIINKTIYYFFKYTVYIFLTVILGILLLFIYRRYEKERKKRKRREN